MMMGTNVAASANSLDMTHTTHSAKTPHFHTTEHHNAKALRTKARSLGILLSHKTRIFSSVPVHFFPASNSSDLELVENLELGVLGQEFFSSRLPKDHRHFLFRALVLYGDNRALSE